MPLDAGSPRVRAAATLLALMAVVWIGWQYPAPALGSAPPERTDFALFETVVNRLKAGAPYYEVMGQELDARGYPTGSVFNWRPPFYLALLATGPLLLWRAVLVGLLLALVVATVVCLRPIGLASTVLGTTLQTGILAISAAPPLVFLGDTWAGALLGLSTALRVCGVGATAAVPALLALAFRELAAPYCVAATVIAVANRRRRELLVWVSGALLYGACYTWHVREVWAHPVPEHAVRASAWLHLGGVPFLLSAIRWTGWAFLLPSASLAVILALIVGGIVNPRGQIHVRVISATYAVLFLFVGQPFNNYWGLVAAPVWALAMVYGAQLVAHDCLVLSGISQNRGQMS